MLASRVLTWCVVGCLLAACGDSKKTARSRNDATGANSGTSGADGGAGTSGGGASGSGAGVTGGGAGGPGGGGTASGGTAGSGRSAGDAGEAGDASGGDPAGGAAGASGASGDSGSGGDGGTGGEGGGDPLGRGFEGIYTFDDAVRNAASCDPGGMNVRTAYEATHLVVRSSTVGGRQVLVVTGCSGLAACRALGAALVDDATAFELVPYDLFTSEAPAGTFNATSVFYGTLDGMTCRDGGIHRVSLSFNGAALTHEERYHITDYPAVGGACPPSAASQQGAAAPCTQLWVLTGTRVETF